MQQGRFSLIQILSFFTSHFIKTHTHTHTRVCLLHCSGHPELLGRCAAGADVVPLRGKDSKTVDCILVCGGYGSTDPNSNSDNYTLYNDLVKIDTKE